MNLATRGHGSEYRGLSAHGYAKQHNGDVYNITYMYGRFDGILVNNAFHGQIQLRFNMNHHSSIPLPKMIVNRDYS